MTYTMFVEELELLAPSRESLKSKNLPDDFIDQFLRRYRCKRRIERADKIRSENELINLMLNYDCSSVEVGIVNFLPEIISHSDCYEIAHAEKDIIVINKTTLGVNVVDPLNTSHIIWKCASGGKEFLESLLLCAKYFTERVLNFALMSDSAYASNVATECSMRAGGDEYMKFYKMLFGMNV